MKAGYILALLWSFTGQRRMAEMWTKVPVAPEQVNVSEERKHRAERQPEEGARNCKQRLVIL